MGGAGRESFSRSQKNPCDPPSLGPSSVLQVAELLLSWPLGLVSEALPPRPTCDCLQDSLLRLLLYKQPPQRTLHAEAINCLLKPCVFSWLRLKVGNPGEGVAWHQRGGKA